VGETVRFIEEAGGRALALTVDVSEAGAVQQMTAQVEDGAAPVDLLVNNAAVVAPLGPVWEVAPDDWWRLMEVNLLGTFLTRPRVP
jgi:NAD(P)-dependent dehydrogenase (short-subunit alcohol dehydrogenase family)